MNFEARDFPFKNMFYKMYRARDMGEYVPIYQSEKQKKMNKMVATPAANGTCKKT